MLCLGGFELYSRWVPLSTANIPLALYVLYIPVVMVPLK